MRHRNFLRIAGFGFMLAAFFHVPVMAKEKERPPNIIFMMADDLGYGDVGFNGNRLVKTPHLDKMAAGGIRFTRFYSVSPVCSPTRANVQTGRHCMRFGMINVNTGKLPAGEINIAQIAKSRGYTTGHFGKWHLGTLTMNPEKAGPGQTPEKRYAPPWERHYDRTFATYTNIATWDPLDEEGLKIPKHRAVFWLDGKEVKGDFKGSSEAIIVDRAIEFFKQSVATGKPFMATVWFYGPHSPVRAGKALRDLYPGQPLGCQHYLGSITSIDHEVGRIRDCLKTLGVEDKTLIFFCSDNGPEGSGNPPPRYNPYNGANYGSAGEFKGRKRYLYNGGVCVPAFAFWPDVIRAGRTVDDPVCALDYLPTLAALLDYQMPDNRPIDGQSILPLLKREKWKRKAFIPFASNLQKLSPTAGILDGDYKFMFWIGSDKPDELYHIYDDPGEKHNLVKQKPELAAEHKKKLDNWLASARHSYEKGDYPGYQKQGDFLPTGVTNARKNRDKD